MRTSCSGDIASDMRGEILIMIRFLQIPPDLVVKSQVTDIIDIILQLIRRPNGVHRAWRNRKSRSELLSTPEVQWSTTKSDGVWSCSLPCCRTYWRMTASFP